MKKVIVLLTLVFAGSALFVVGQQGDLIKKKAKNLKRDVESKQTNSVPQTNSPAKH